MPEVRLLLVDDEGALAGLLQKYLERLGYQVDVCGSAEEALPRFEADPQRYALVLSDLTLPGMNGDDLIDRLRAINPRLKAIVASGYPHQPRSRDIEFLQKPFLPKMLAEMLEKKLKS